MAASDLDVFLRRILPAAQSSPAAARDFVWEPSVVEGRLTKPAYRLVTGQRVRLVLPPAPRRYPLPRGV